MWNVFERARVCSCLCLCPCMCKGKTDAIRMRFNSDWDLSSVQRQLKAMSGRDRLLKRHQITEEGACRYTIIHIGIVVVAAAACWLLPLLLPVRFHSFGYNRTQWFLPIHAGLHSLVNVWMICSMRTRVRVYYICETECGFVRHYAFLHRYVRFCASQVVCWCC